MNPETKAIFIDRIEDGRLAVNGKYSKEKALLVQTLANGKAVELEISKNMRQTLQWWAATRGCKFRQFKMSDKTWACWIIKREELKS